MASRWTFTTAVLLASVSVCTHAAMIDESNTGDTALSLKGASDSAIDPPVAPLPAPFESGGGAFSSGLVEDPSTYSAGLPVLPTVRPVTDGFGPGSPNINVVPLPAPVMLLLSALGLLGLVRRRLQAASS